MLTFKHKIKVIDVVQAELLRLLPEAKRTEKYLRSLAFFSVTAKGNYDFAGGL